MQIILVLIKHRIFHEKKELKKLLSWIKPSKTSKKSAELKFRVLQSTRNAGVPRAIAYLPNLQR